MVMEDFNIQSNMLIEGEHVKEGRTVVKLVHAIHLRLLVNSLEVEIYVELDI